MVVRVDRMVWQRVEYFVESAVECVHVPLFDMVRVVIVLMELYQTDVDAE